MQSTTEKTHILNFEGIIIGNPNVIRQEVGIELHRQLVQDGYAYVDARVTEIGEDELTLRVYSLRVKSRDIVGLGTDVRRVHTFKMSRNDTTRGPQLTQVSGPEYHNTYPEDVWN